MKKVKIEVWSDFVCPWCWIAKRRLEKAIAALGGQVDVSVTTKAYRLAKGMAPADYMSALDQKFGNRQAAQGLMTAVRENGAREGLIYNFEAMRFGDTTMAHALIKSIASTELAGALTERIYKAATTDGLDIFDRDVLMSLAHDAGVAAAPLDLAAPPLISQIARDEAQANAIANGVPLFLFNNRTYLSGAREVDVFKRVLLDAATEAPAAVDAEGGETCGIDGCAL